ncbi:MAG: hypothetical protein LBD21_03915 [Tannerellaceae bacterium]|jgi:photosystem II stability/assembly factor-like uncharacterized protein|nr:hypothetical protein [Tannerellaceae bacterium]
MKYALQKWLLAFLVLSSGCRFAENPNASEYVWKTLKVGGGGWVTGMYIHPAEPGLRYVRTDVSGAYLWDATSGRWKQIVTDASMPAEYVKYAAYDGVCSLVGATSNPNIAYMAFRDQIFRSADRGDSWTATAFNKCQVKMLPNGPGRFEGERLAVDPNNENVVYYGSADYGLWATYDAGANWLRIESIPSGEEHHGVNTIVFDGKSGMTDNKTNLIYVTVHNGGVYRSLNAGKDWECISDDGPGANRRYMDAEIGADGVYYVVATNDYISTTNNRKDGCVWKYGNNKWTDITPDGPDKKYFDVAINPSDVNHIAVTCNGRGMYVSHDQGKEWQSCRDFELVSPTIEWLGMQDTGWLSVGELSFDPFEAGKLWFAEGFGVWWTKEPAGGRIVWTAESEGIEESCGNTVLVPPGGKPLSAMWDIGVFHHRNPDTYDAIRAYDYFLSGWHLDWCPADPKFIAGVFQTHLAYNNEPKNSYSTDGGKTWTPFESQPEELAYGCVAVSADNKDNIVRLPANNHLPYYTKDRGKTWTQCAMPGISHSGYNSHSSPAKPICADRVAPGTFYFYQHDNGLFRSTDSGANWAILPNCPALNRYNAMMKTAPGHSGDIWFAEGKGSLLFGGLWRSTDGGETWTPVDGPEQVFSFGFGKEGQEGGFPTVFAAGVAKGEYGLYRSTDTGKTWSRIGTYPLGIFDYVDDIDGDKNEFGKVYISFASAGFAYGAEYSY